MVTDAVSLVIPRLLRSRRRHCDPRRPRPSSVDRVAHRARRGHAAAGGGSVHRPLDRRRGVDGRGAPLAVRGGPQPGRGRPRCTGSPTMRGASSCGASLRPTPTSSARCRCTTSSTPSSVGASTRWPRSARSSCLDLHSYNHRRDGARHAGGLGRGEPRGQRRDRFTRPRGLGAGRRPVHRRARSSRGPSATGWTSGRTSASAAASSAAGSTSATRAEAARWRSSSRRSSWTSGPATLDEHHVEELRRALGAVVPAVIEELRCSAPR